MARRGYLKHNEFDIYMIMYDLDCKTGMKFRNLDIEVDEKLKSLGRCHGVIQTREEYLEKAYKGYECASEEEKINIQKIIDEVEKSDVETFCRPVKFSFSLQTMNLPYKEFRETVIHEYAHAWTWVKCFIKFEQMEDDGHGKMFQDTVRELGGSAIHSHAEMEEGYNNRIYSRARELGLQYTYPYTVHYVYPNGLPMYTIRRKTNCKAIKECEKRYGDWLEVVDVHEIKKRFGREIVVVAKDEYWRSREDRGEEV